MRKGVAQKLSLPRPLEYQTLNGHKSANFKARDFFFWIWIAEFMSQICTKTDKSGQGIEIQNWFFLNYGKMVGVRAWL